MQISDPLNDKVTRKATRDGYGAGLVSIGKSRSNVVVLDADLSGSTKTGPFAAEFPDRFYNFGVAEQNMIGQAAGFAMSGLIPVASSFAMFVTGRAWEIVRNSVAYPGLNVKLAATHAGITLGEDGASHQTIEDIALMRAIPGMTVIVPADYWQAFRAIERAVEFDGPVYLRLGRPGIPMLYDENDDFAIGKADIVQEGSKVAILATGVMVYEGYKAARLLEQKTGIRPMVVNFSTIKPLDEEMMKRVVSGCDEILTLEEHNVLGGFGSAVAEWCGTHHPIKVTRIGVDDIFGQSGTIDSLMKEYSLTAGQVSERIAKALKVTTSA